MDLVVLALLEHLEYLEYLGNLMGLEAHVSLKRHTFTTFTENIIYLI